MADCPRCRLPLRDGKIAGRPVAECPKCAGVWASLAVFQQLYSDADAQAIIIAIPEREFSPPALPPPPVVPRQPAKRVEYLHCPACGNLMNRLRFAQGSSVVTNACRKHGIWTDLSAIQEIVAFILAGGLERALQKANEESQRKSDGEYLTTLISACRGNLGKSGFYG